MNRQIIPIFSHRYTMTSWYKNKMGVQQVMITIVDEHKNSNTFEAVELVLKFFEQDINIEHKIILTGYRQGMEK